MTYSYEEIDNFTTAVSNFYANENKTTIFEYIEQPVVGGIKFELKRKGFEKSDYAGGCFVDRDDNYLHTNIFLILDGKTELIDYIKNQFMPARSRSLGILEKLSEKDRQGFSGAHPVMEL